MAATEIFRCLSGSQCGQACFEPELSAARAHLPHAGPACTVPTQHPRIATGSICSKVRLASCSPPPASQQPMQSHKAQHKKTSSSGFPQSSCPHPRKGAWTPPHPAADLHDTAQRPHVRLWPMALSQQHFWGQVVGGPTYCPVGQGTRSVHALHPLTASLPLLQALGFSLSSPLHFALCGPKPPLHLQGVPYTLPPLQLTGVSSSCSWGAVGKSLSQS